MKKNTLRNKKRLTRYILCFSILITACSKSNILDIRLSEEKQMRTDYCSRSFSSYTKETKNGSYVVESSIASKEEAMSLIETIESDLNKIQTALPSLNTQNTKFFIVDADISDGELLKNAYCKDDVIVSNISCIKDGSYLKSLIQGVLGCKEEWIAYGIKSLVYEDEIDNTALKQYYSIEENLETLHLSDIRFIAALCSEEDIAIAKDTSASIIKYINEIEPLELTLKKMISGEVDTEIYKNKWLSYLEVPHEYSWKYEGLLNSYQITPSSESLIIAENDYLNFQITYSTDREYLLRNAGNVEMFLIRANEQLANIRTQIKLNTNNSSNNFEEQKLIVYVNEMMDAASHASIDGSELYLSNTEDAYGSKLLEQAVLYYLNATLTEENTWYLSGISNYIESLVTQEDDYNLGTKKQYYYNAFTHILKQIKENTFAEEFDGQEQYYQEVYRIYTENGGSLVSLEEFSYEKFDDAMGKADQLNDMTSVNGATSLVRYIVSKYTLADAFVVASDYSQFDNVFKANLETVKKEWVSFH